MSLGLGKPLANLYSYMKVRSTAISPGSSGCNILPSCAKASGDMKMLNFKGKKGQSSDLLNIFCILVPPPPV